MQGLAECDKNHGNQNDAYFLIQRDVIIKTIQTGWFILKIINMKNTISAKCSKARYSC